ncbi:hypothetical protein Cci01nite_44990 [Catellatospora citrea]|uniref:Uncharacterized protein n=1 Tax=Catellatospora citrea TaxID=53366 RepID=A0A8J3KLR0_9ACTN|nr:hypothetical protein Cci01nite_44990 [Catellatospora citrea]
MRLPGLGLCPVAVRGLDCLRRQDGRGAADEHGQHRADCPDKPASCHTVLPVYRKKWIFAPGARFEQPGSRRVCGPGRMAGVRA